MVALDDFLIQHGQFEDICKMFFYGFESSDNDYLKHLVFKINFLTTEGIYYSSFGHRCYDIKNFQKILADKNGSNENNPTILDKDYENENFAGSVSLGSPESRIDPCAIKEHILFSDMLYKYFTTLRPEIITKKKQRINITTIDFDNRRYDVIDGEVYETHESNIKRICGTEYEVFQYRIQCANVHRFPSNFPFEFLVNCGEVADDQEITKYEMSDCLFDLMIVRRPRNTKNNLKHALYSLEIESREVEDFIQVYFKGATEIKTLISSLMDKINIIYHEAIKHRICH